MKPSFVHICPNCLACDSTTVPWRTAIYLLNSGATTITAPDRGQIQPRYPERRPNGSRPMSLGTSSTCTPRSTATPAAYEKEHLGLALHAPHICER